MVRARKKETILQIVSACHTSFGSGSRHWHMDSSMTVHKSPCCEKISRSSFTWGETWGIECFDCHWESPTSHPNDIHIESALEGPEFLFGYWCVCHPWKVLQNAKTSPTGWRWSLYSSGQYIDWCDTVSPNEILLLIGGDEAEVCWRYNAVVWTLFGSSRVNSNKDSHHNSLVRASFEHCSSGSVL